jgi:hypothetical protein
MAWPKDGPVPPRLVWPSWLPSHDSNAQCPSPDEKLAGYFFLWFLMSVRSLEQQNTKRRFYSSEKFKTNEENFVGKSCK